MTATPPETEARQALILALEETYAEEKFPIRSERLHKSRGDEHTIVGVYPDRTRHGRNANVQEMMIIVQFYGYWKRGPIDREHTHHPNIIEAFAERFREKLRSIRAQPATAAVWYFMLEETRFPPDPVEGSTRYEMVINARGNNTALLETS